jgi:hypothetical protein
MYERLINTMQGFFEQRKKDGVALMNGKLPPKQQRKMDSLFTQVLRIVNKQTKKIAEDNGGESIWNSVVGFSRQRIFNNEEYTSDLGEVWAAERIRELENKPHDEVLLHDMELMQKRIDDLEANYNGLVRCIYNFWDKRRDNAGFISHFEDNKIMQRPENDSL